MEVSQRRVVPAPPEVVWADVADPQRFAEWYAFCDDVEVPEPGVRVLHGSWGARRSAVVTRITAEEPPHRLAWRHVSETLDGEPAPAVAIATEVEVRLHPVEEGTEVELVSRQAAAGWWQAAAMRLLGRRQIADVQRQSLALLEARHRR